MAPFLHRRKAARGKVRSGAAPQCLAGSGEAAHGTHASLSQLAENFLGMEEVVGSSPTGGSI